MFIRKLVDRGRNIRNIKMFNIFFYLTINYTYKYITDVIIT
jgi:hypothetical protein